MQKLKVNDEVIVIAGKDKGKTGKVINVSYETMSIQVEGVNIQKRAIKPSKENPSGGISDKTGYINLSNVQHYSAKLRKPSRVGIVTKNGKKTRVLKKCGTVLK